MSTIYFSLIVFPKLPYDFVLFELNYVSVIASTSLL